MKHETFFRTLIDHLEKLRDTDKVIRDDTRLNSDNDVILRWAENILNPPFQIKSWGSNSPTFPLWLQEQEPQNMEDLLAVQKRVLEERLSNTMITQGKVTVLWLDKGKFGQT